jgi:hypothetical protein
MGVRMIILFPFCPNQPTYSIEYIFPLLAVDSLYLYFFRKIQLKKVNK